MAAKEEEEEWQHDDFLALEATATTDANKKQKTNGSSSHPQRRQLQQRDNGRKNGKNGADIPPWLNSPHLRHVHPMVCLNNEIVAFTRLMEPSPEEIATRQAVIERVKDLVATCLKETCRCKVEVFGSTATGLLLPSSDIDLVVTTKDGSEDGGEEEYTPGSPMRQVGDFLREQLKEEVSYFQVIENTRVPIIKFTLQPSNLAVDISFDIPNGLEAAKLMKRFMKQLPPLRPLTFVLKYFLATRGLNEPYTGGVGSFLLQMMLVAFLQYRERYLINFGRRTHYNLGVLLLEFFRFFGLEFNYCTTGISVRNKGFFFPRGGKRYRENFTSSNGGLLLALENPLDPTQNVAQGSFRIDIVQRAMAIAFRQLMCYVTQPFERPGPSLLGHILPVGPEISSRKRVESLPSQKHEGDSLSRPLSAKRGRQSNPQPKQSQKKRRRK